MKSLSLFVTGCLLISGCGDKAPAPLTFEEKAKQTIETRAKEWASSKVEVIAKAEAALAAGKLDEARGVISKYGQVAGAELADFVRKLEVAEAEHRMRLDREDTLQKLASNKDNPSIRRSLLKHMMDIEPINPKWKAEFRAVDQKIDSDIAKARQKEAARRRREGVTIGMTQEDVLASNWGRPQSRNISQYSFGTHEQWVYGGGQYLYFENGILKSMQTSR